MPCGARCGKGRDPRFQHAGVRASGRAAFREAAAVLRAGPPSPSRTCPRTATPRGLTIDLRARSGWPAVSNWESMGGVSSYSGRPRPWPGGLTIGPGWDGCLAEISLVLRLTGDPNGAISRQGQQAL